VELEQSLAVVMANTGDSPATILKNNANLLEVVMRRQRIGNLPTALSLLLADKDRCTHLL
jgi:hypothetical protein